ncbi:hypothetical protein FSP39_004429 [Pinctada imbricata]|uniref:DUF5077 domain-containing protein n=1 Tax=Pinctada imbricata TaxID=66713 RepID=A0AA89BY05_PINIB|nr:hypothetical protein FSP39_004429 [Pinctada imbricata]
MDAGQTGMAIAQFESLAQDCCSEESHPRCARAVHLRYQLPQDTVTVYNQVTVLDSCRGSYFCVIGFYRGYCGIQELRNGQKRVIFSVWDVEENCSEENQVQVLYHGDGVQVSRFGGEGTGAKTMFPFDWCIGEPVKFKLTAAVDDDKKRSSFSCYVFMEEKMEWFHIATMKTLTNGCLIRGVYSFVEDFFRNRKSYHDKRRAHFGTCFAEHSNGETVVYNKARFTASNSEAININGCCCDGQFLLETGADIQNTGAKLKDFITLESVKNE